MKKQFYDLKIHTRAGTIAYAYRGQKAVQRAQRRQAHSGKLASGSVEVLMLLASQAETS